MRYETRIHMQKKHQVFARTRAYPGGFVAQTSASHMVYLRAWAAYLRVPILSVDYTLAPHAPGTALGECFYAYKWILAHARELNVRPDRIVISGDSAGGICCPCR